MLLSVILCSHIAAGGLADESVSLLGRRRPEIRVAPRSVCGGSLGGWPRRPPWPACGDRPGPPGREVPEGPEVPAGREAVALAPGVRRPGRDGAAIVLFTHPDK